MKIFTQNDRPQSISKESPGDEKRPTKLKRSIPKAPPLSDTEVREKLAAHVETSKRAKTENAKNSEALGAGFMNPDARPLVKKTEEAPTEKKENESESSKAMGRMSDVQINDPKDSNTQEKLKTALRTGAFNFSSKERDALEKILNG